MQTIDCTNESGFKRKGPRLENVDESTSRAFSALGHLMHANRLAMGKLSGSKGPHHGKMIALALLENHDGIGQSELGEIMHLSASRVSIIVDELEKSGLIQRREDEADRRVTHVFLTAEGRKREKAQRDRLGEFVNRTIGALPEDDRLELARLLEQLAGEMMAMLHDEPATDGPEGGIGQ